MRSGNDLTNPSTFVHCVLRAVAWACLIAGIVSILNYGATVVDRHFQWNPTLEIGLAAAIALVQVVGAATLLRWNPMGRSLLIIWAWLSIAFGFVGVGMIAFRFLVTPPSLGFGVMITIAIALNILTHCIMPALIIYLLTRREVRNLWPTASTGGFEAIPMAQALENPPAES